MHLGALELTLTAENWAAPVTVRTAIDGRVVNRGAQLYRPFNNTHLEPLASTVVGEDGVALLVRTCQSYLHVAQAARTQAFVEGQLCESARQVLEEPGYIGQELTIDLQQGATLVLEKLVAWYTSRDPAIAECGLAARQALTRARRFEAVLAEHRVAWQYLWRHFDVHLQPTGPAFTLNVPMLLRLNMLHLLQAVSPNSIGLDIGVPPRGWTGEAYQGHIFWDELFISHSIVFSGRGYHCSAKPSRGEDLQIEEPVACWYTPAFHFHPTLPSMLGSTLIRDQVVEVCQSCEKRFLTAPWVMKPFHGEEFPLDGVVGLI